KLSRKYGNPNFFPLPFIAPFNHVEIKYCCFWCDRHATLKFKFNHVQYFFARCGPGYVGFKYIRSLLGKCCMGTENTAQLLFDTDECRSQCLNIFYCPTLDDARLEWLFSPTINAITSAKRREYKPFDRCIRNIDTRCTWIQKGGRGKCARDRARKR